MLEAKAEEGILSYDFLMQSQGLSTRLFGKETR